MERVRKHSREDANGCWTWTGGTDNGYGIIRLKDPRRLYPARRYSYETWNGITLPKNWIVMTTCKNTLCVNPAHIFGVQRGHQHVLGKLHPPEHCQRGHEFSPWNTRTQNNGGKLCLACEKERHRLSMLKWRAENPAHAKAVRLARAQARRDWVASQKLACIRCGETDVACLDFHHRTSADKAGTLAVAISGWSIPRMAAEVAKCDVLCSNCHRKLHAALRAGEIPVVGLERIGETGTPALPIAH